MPELSAPTSLFFFSSFVHCDLNLLHFIYFYILQTARHVEYFEPFFFSQWYFKLSFTLLTHPFPRSEKGKDNETGNHGDLQYLLIARSCHLHERDEQPPFPPQHPQSGQEPVRSLWLTNRGSRFD